LRYAIRKNFPRLYYKGLGSEWWSNKDMSPEPVAVALFGKALCADETKLAIFR
jgi:hypothetical protein